MKTRIKKLGDKVIVSLDGKVDYETQEPFRDHLNKLLADSKKDEIPKQIIFDLERLEFVGSSHITAMIQVLKDFNQDAPLKPVYCNVGSEFQKIIKAFEENDEFQFDEFINDEPKNKMLDH